MKAVILAAGKGTRMGALTKDMPKPLIPVAGKPVLEHIVTRLSNAGVKEFVFITRYLAEKIRDYFGDGSKFGIKVDYVLQSDKYGTGAALYEAKDLVGKDEPVMMTYGDIITPACNYSGAISVFGSKTCEAVMTLNYVEDPWRGGAVYIGEDGKVNKIVEKPPKGEVSSHWNSAGIFVFQPAIFKYLERLQPSPRGEYELPDAINAMITDGLPVYPYYLEGAWRDVGTVEDIAIAEEILLQEGNR